MRRAGLQCLNRRITVIGGSHRFLRNRPISYGIREMSGILPKVDPPLLGTSPADAYQLLPENEKPGKAEDALFDAQVSQVKDWWSSPRYAGIKRPYSADAVVSKRGTLQQVYPSSLMARKLFNLLEERASQSRPIHTSTSPA